MDKLIICEYHLFDLHQKILLASGDGSVKEVGISNIQDLGENIAALCQQHGAKEVHLIGNADFAYNNIIPVIYSKFAENEIKVEVH